MCDINENGNSVDLRSDVNFSSGKFDLSSEEEVVEEEAEEEKCQDPVEGVDVDDDQADVEEPAAHVGQVQSLQRESSVDKVPAPPGRRRPSLVSPEGTEASSTAGKRPPRTRRALEALLAGGVDFREEVFHGVVELFMEAGV